MFKLVVLFAFVGIAVSSPIPSLTASGYAYSSSIHAPDYVSHQSVHAPLLVEPHHAVVQTYAYPAAVSHQSHTQIHAKPYIVAPILAPAVHSYHAAPLVHGW